MNSQIVTVQHINTRVLLEGEGAPVVFVHGNPDSADLWREVIGKLPAGFRYIAPDLPGFGQAGSADSFDWSIANRGRWLADLLDALAIREPVVLVGHDHGGPFVASFAVQYPDRVSKLVLQNTLFHADYKWHPMAKLWRLPLVGEYLAFTQRFRINLPLVIAVMKVGSPLLTTRYISHLQQSWTPQMGRAMLAVYRATTPAQLGEWEQRLRDFISSHATLVLWGMRDIFLPVRFAEGWERDGATLIRFPAAGHWLAVEQPSEFAQALADFLRR